MPYLSSMSEDEDDDDLLLQGCEKDLQTLKEACRSFCDDDQSEDEEEHVRLPDVANDDDDDDVLLLSIQKRFGASRLAEEVPLSPYSAEEDDDVILRAVQERFSKPSRKENGAGVGKCAIKASCSFQESITTLNKRASAVEAQAASVCNVLAPLSERSGFWLSGEVDSVSECHVSLSAQALRITSPPRTPLGISSPAHTPEQTEFQLPEQVELLDDSAEGLSDGLVDGFGNGNVLLTSFSGDYHKQSTQCALDALKKNRLLQRVLMHKLECLKLKLEENSHLKKQVRALLEFQDGAKRKYAVEEEDSVSDDGTTKKRRISASLCVRAECGQWGRCRPPENADVAKFKAMQKKYCLTFEPKAWTKEERIELVKGVEQQVQESCIRSIMNMYSASNNDATFLDDQVRTIAEHPPTPEEIRKALAIINWSEVSRLYVIGRSPTECWIQWSNHEDSLINHGAWTKSEDKRLWSIVKQHKLCNWDHISQALGSRRTIAQCLVRYQRSLNSGIMRGAWTQEEDQQLRAAVQQYGDQDWLSVAAALEGRTGPQCWNRWRKILNPIRQKSGRWSVIEDKRLRLAVSVYGPRMWKMIAVHIPGRTEVQCRERWCNILDPSLTLAEWTLEEDQQLEAAVAKYGSHRWSTVASELRPRTDNQCWRRWKYLHPELLSDFQKDNKIQRAALISNFVGRKRERSKLCPRDFVPEPGAFDTSEEACKQDGVECEWVSEEGLTNALASRIPRADIGLSFGSRESSKKRRLERLEKLREARATGKLLKWKRATPLSNLHMEKHKKPVQQQKKRFTAKSTCNPSKNGTTAFVKAMHELANICQKMHIKGRDSNSPNGVFLPVSTIHEGQFRTVGSSVSDMSMIDKTEDEEIEAAVKAVVSWPFMWAMQDLLGEAL